MVLMIGAVILLAHGDLLEYFNSDDTGRKLNILKRHCRSYVSEFLRSASDTPSKVKGFAVP